MGPGKGEEDKRSNKREKKMKKETYACNDILVFIRQAQTYIIHPPYPPNTTTTIHSASIPSPP